MTCRSWKLLLGLSSLLLTAGCQPTPVVVDPDGDATVVEERDVVVEDKIDATPSSDSGTDVNVDIGGGKGVDVDVNRKSDANP